MTLATDDTIYFLQVLTCYRMLQWFEYLWCKCYSLLHVLQTLTEHFIFTTSVTLDWSFLSGCSVTVLRMLPSVIHQKRYCTAWWHLLNPQIVVILSFIVVTGIVYELLARLWHKCIVCLIQGMFCNIQNNSMNCNDVSPHGI